MTTLQLFAFVLLPMLIAAMGGIAVYTFDPDRMTRHALIKLNPLPIMNFVRFEYVVVFAVLLAAIMAAFTSVGIEELKNFAGMK